MAVKFERTGMLLIISGPSGTGKGTLVKKLMDSFFSQPYVMKKKLPD